MSIAFVVEPVRRRQMNTIIERLVDVSTLAGRQALGDWVTTERHQRNLSQAALAALANLAQGTISQVERGEIVTSATYLAIFRVFNWHADIVEAVAITVSPKEAS